MMSPSPVSAGVSRRVALGATGAGVLAALTACASDIRPLADSSPSGEASASASESASASASASASSSSSDKSYKGLVKFDNFEKKGEYVPATAEKKAQNVPKPLVPANMNEQNVDGMYAFIGYWLASLNYLMMTGNPGPIEIVYHDGYGWEKYPSTIKLYASGLGWVYGTETPYIVELLTDAPREVPGSNNTRFIWEGYSYMDPKMMRHYNGQPEKATSADESKKKVARFRLDYKDGKWELSSAA